MKALIIVVTRLHASKGTRQNAGQDEYYSHWNTGREIVGEQGTFYNLSQEGDALLVVHGHKGLHEDKTDDLKAVMARVLADALLDISISHDFVQLPDLEKNEIISLLADKKTTTVSPAENIAVYLMVHGRKLSNQAASVAFTLQDFPDSLAHIAGFKNYSLGEGGTPGFLNALKSLILESSAAPLHARAVEISAKIEEKALDPSELQVMYVQEVRQLLLALLLDAAVAMQAEIPNPDAWKHVEEAYLEIARRVQGPAMQLLKNGSLGTPSRRIYVVADRSRMPKSLAGEYKGSKLKFAILWNALREGREVSKALEAEVVLEAQAEARKEKMQAFLKSLESDVKEIGDGLSALLEIISEKRLPI